MRAHVLLSALLAVQLAAPLARADEAADREADMFGAAPEQAADAPAPATDKKGEDAREDELFGTSPVQTPTPQREQKAEERAPDPGLAPVDQAAIVARAAAANDKLAIGGRLFNQNQYSHQEDQPWRDGTLSLPTLLDVYLDGRPSDRVRAYVRGRLQYDPTQVDGRPNAFGGTQQSLAVSLDQLWVKWDAYQRVFFTLGRQRVKWGAGRFWNPTDFLNPQRLNAIAILDTRLGTTLFKVHVPVESLGWNFYAIANLTGASTPADAGGALRGEFVFGPAELTLSTQVRRAAAPGTFPASLVTQGATTIPGANAEYFKLNSPLPDASVDTQLQLGADLSVGVGPVDLRVEGALVHGSKALYVDRALTADDVARAFTTAGGGAPLPVRYRDDEWVAQVVGGFETSIKYSDEDAVTVGAEYFYNSVGTSDAATYATLAAVGNFAPFYLGRHYASAFAALPNPGTLNNTSFTLSWIGNLSDGSSLARFDYAVTVLTNLTVRAFTNLHLGDNGEFKLGGAFTGLPIGTSAASAAVLTPVTLDLGVGLILNI
jgi:hypothetical protein